MSVGSLTVEIGEMGGFHRGESEFLCANEGLEILNNTAILLSWEYITGRGLIKPMRVAVLNVIRTATARGFLTIKEVNLSQ